MTIRVAAILIREGTPDILLVRTNKSHLWMLPGGLTKHVEPPSESILRHLHEKLGLSLPSNAEPDVVAVTGSTVTVLFRWGSLPAGVEFVTQMGDIVECAWVDRDQVLAGSYVRVHHRDLALLIEWDRHWKWDSPFMGTLYVERWESGSFVRVGAGRNG